MATRLYLTRNAPNPGTNVPTPDAEWNVTAGALSARMTLGKGIDALSNVVTSASAVADNDNLIYRGISPPLDVDQTITGNVKGQAKVVESVATFDGRSQTVIRVVQPDGSIRGTLLAASTGALSNEWPITTYTNRKFPVGGSAALGSVAALAGDRISVELGARQHAAIATTIGINLGSAVSDLAEDESSTAANAPWIEFDQTITFADNTQMRASRVTGTALIQTTSQMRASRVTLTALVQWPRTSAAAGSATGTGTAHDAIFNTGFPTVSANAGVASGAGVAQVAISVIAPNVGTTAGTGAAYGPTTEIDVATSAATGTGAAANTTPRIGPNAELVSGTGQAYDATVSTQVATNVDAGLAAATGSAHPATTQIVVNAGAVSGTGAAYDATARSEVVVSAGVASGTGAALAVTAHVVVNAGLASATGQAFGVSQRSVGQAEVVSGTGAAYGAGPYVAVNTAALAATGIAYDATAVAGVFTYANAELASGTGAAYDITTQVVVNAGLASGTGTAQAASGAQLVSASFGLDAEISIPGDTHDRREAHFGTQDDTTITIIEPLGPLPAGTTLDVVLAYLYGEVVTLDSGLYFGLDAWIDIYIGLDAVIQDEMTDSFGLDAWLMGGTSFGFDAIVKASRGTTFGLGAVIHSPSEPWNVAYAPFGGGEVSYDAVTTNYQPPSQAANGILHYNFFGDAWEKGSASAVGDWWKVTWTVPQTINRVVIYNTDYSFGPTGFLEFSDGSQVPYTGLLPGTRDVEADWNTSFVLTIDFAAKVTSSLRVVSNGGGSSRVALAEVEIFNTDQWEE